VDMKYILKIALLLLIGTVLYSCKKGDEDPAISFRTRKARLTGNWEGTNYSSEINFTNALTNRQTISSKETINAGGSDISIKTESDTKIITATGNISFHNLEITKDGNYFYSLQYNIVSSYPDSTPSGTKFTVSKKVSKTINKQGKWAFTGKLDGSKNKENVLFTLNSVKENITTETNTITNGVSSIVTKSDDTEEIYETGEIAEVWQIVQLKNKTLKLEMQVKNSNTGKSSTTTSIGTTSIDLPVISNEGIVNLGFKQ
jgi:hypothetical protein